MQINCEVGEVPGADAPRINIVDILKPAEEVQDSPPPRPRPPASRGPTSSELLPQRQEAVKEEVDEEDKEEVTRWVVDQQFRKEQERLGIPHGNSSYFLSAAE